MLVLASRARSFSLALRVAVVLAAAVTWGSAGVGCGGSDSNACADKCVEAVKACQAKPCPPNSICQCVGGEACLKQCYG